MKDDHFLSNVTCISYKGLQNFTVDNLRRINLIGGRNNIGKTSFLEACHINVSSADFDSYVTVLQEVKYRRENLNILAQKGQYNVNLFLSNAQGINIQSNIGNVAFDVEAKEGSRNYIFNCANQKIIVDVNKLGFIFKRLPNVEFIDSFGLSNDEIIAKYTAIQKNDQEAFLNVTLQEFDDSITGFKVFGDSPQCKVNDKWLELTEMGDGVGHLVSIVTSLFSSANGYLFIDEVENGIHYTYLKKLWEIIFKVSKEVNCQVFTTSHSKECIEAFNTVNKSNEDGLYLEFYKNQKDNTIYAISREADQLDYELSHGGEVRGE